MDTTIHKKREQNRIAQRTYRSKLRHKITELERKVESQAKQLAAQATSSDQASKTSTRVGSLASKPQEMMLPTPKSLVSPVCGTDPISSARGMAKQHTESARGGRPPSSSGLLHEDLTDHSAIMHEKPTLRGDDYDSNDFDFDWSAQFSTTMDTTPASLVLTDGGILDGVLPRDRNMSLSGVSCADFGSSVADTVIDSSGNVSLAHTQYGDHSCFSDIGKSSVASRLDYLLICMVACGFQSFEELSVLYYEAPLLNTPDPALRLREARIQSFPRLIQRIVSRHFAHSSENSSVE